MRELFITHVRPLLEYAPCAWNTGYIEDSQLLESVQRRWTKKVSSLEDLSYGVRLRRLDLFSVKGRLLRCDLIKVWKIFNGKCKVPFDSLFQLGLSLGYTRGHSLKLQVPRFRLACRQRFFSVRVVNLWNNLPQSVVSTRSLEVFKAGIRDALDDLLFQFD